MRIRHIPRSCCLLLIQAAPSIALAQGPAHVALLSHRVTNTGEGTARSVKAICILPTTNNYQEVLDLQIEPEPAQVRTDAEGQKVITVDLGDIPPGETRAVYVMAWARLKPLLFDLLVPPRRPAVKLGSEIEAGMLTDGSLLHLGRVRPIARQAAGTSARDLDRARAMFEYMTRQCTYDIDEKFDPADRILAGAAASCSELSYTFVAMCRSLGIPARIVSAYANRDGTSPSTDWRTHRWAEFYSKEYGWVPADPTNRINEPSKTFFGRQEGKYLTVVDDGVPLAGGPDPGWNVFIAGATAPDTRPASGPAETQPDSEAPPPRIELSRSAVWRVSANRPRETQLFHQACAALRSDDLKARQTAVTAWTRQRELMNYGYLLEALFDADKQIRRQAATALGKSGDVSLLIPLALLASREEDKVLKASLLAAAKTLLNAPTEAKRAQAVAELARSRTAEALELLDGMWKDSSREVRKSVALTLYKFGDKPIVNDAYRELSNDSDEFIRVAAPLRWSRIGSVEADGLLVNMLQSDVQWDRERAIQELSKRTGDKFAFDPTSDPKTQNNQDALTQWRSWIDARTAAAPSR